APIPPALPTEAAAPARPSVPAPASSAREAARAGEVASHGPDVGLGATQVDAIKAVLQAQQKFLWSMLQQATRWEVEGDELRIFFPSENSSASFAAETLQSREPMERLRTVLNQVVGQPLRVCVKLEAGRAAAPRNSELQARVEEDPIVRTMLERFGGQISKVKRPGED
ncbi:MAG: hypothetical protein WA879_13435, partial [Candidatus Acidiferrales bacterium]